MADMREKMDDVHSRLMGLLQRAPYIGCADTDRQYAVNWLMNNGVTIQKTGNWSLRCETYKDYMDEVEEIFHLECSECRRKVWDVNQDAALKGDWAKLIEPFPYCHCGAKMHQEVINSGDGI